MNRYQSLHHDTAAPWSPRHGILQRKCACGNGATANGECEECTRKNEALQRKSANGKTVDDVPPAAQEILRSPGRPLETEVRRDMELRFGHDFSRVRVHTDARAAASAQDVDALAYTVGQSIVFDAGQYAPRTQTGQQLLAHELTHVVQQTQMRGTLDSSSLANAEIEAEQNSKRFMSGDRLSVNQIAAAGTIHRQERKTTLDEKAGRIIANAKDTSKSIEERAKQAVLDIAAAYWDASKISEVVYSEDQEGLATSPVGKGNDIKGKITVGKYFVEHIDSFARRVLQVGHELQHVDQQRAGMGGEANQDKREFLAHSWQAQQPEVAGTGRLSNALRVSLIDAALGYYYCLSVEEQKSYAADKENLLKRREEFNGKSGNPPTSPPETCKRQSGDKRKQRQ